MRQRAAKLALWAVPPTAAAYGLATGKISLNPPTPLPQPQKSAVPPLPLPVAAGVRDNGVLADLNYQHGNVRSIEAAPSGELVGAQWHPQRVLVRDGRRAASCSNLDVNGFAMQHAAKAEHIDYYDESAVTSKYYGECEDIVRRATGASLVVAFDHNVRCDNGKRTGRTMRGGNAVQGAAPFVHNDYTAASASRRLAMLTASPKFLKPSLQAQLGGRPLLSGPAVEEAQAGTRRFALLNVWRPIAPVECKPLGCLDATTVGAEELVTFSIPHSDGGPKEGGIYFATWRAAHDWVYYPRMTPDEVLLVKQWDSEGGLARGTSDAHAKRATFALHSAFADAASPPNPRDRESIEVRLVVVY